MKKIIISIIITSLLFCSCVVKQADAASYFRTLKEGELLSAKTLKWSFFTIALATNSLRMAKEADQFDDRSLLPSNTYHAVDVGYMVGLVTLGYLSYSIVKQSYWTPREKVCLFTSAALGSWEVGEMTYKGMRYDNPYDNDPAHNRNSIPMFTFRDGSFRDAFISTGRVSTILLHAGRTAGASYLLGRVP